MESGSFNGYAGFAHSLSLTLFNGSAGHNTEILNRSAASAKSATRKADSLPGKWRRANDDQSRVWWRGFAPLKRGRALTTQANDVLLSGTESVPTIVDMSVAAPLPEIRRRSPALRIVYYAICFLLVVTIAAVWWLYWIARSASAAIGWQHRGAGYFVQGARGAR